MRYRIYGNAVDPTAAARDNNGGEERIRASAGSKPALYCNRL